jgi:uncharacterized membrane protein
MGKLTTSLMAVSICFILVLLFNLVVAIPVWATNRDSDNPVTTPILQDDAEKIELSCQYPVLSSYAGLNYSYDISVNYTGGKESKIFDLKAMVPQGFNSTISPGYGDGKEIAAIRLDPTKNYPETIKLNIRPYVWKIPSPGEYPVTFEVTSGTLKSIISLKAIVTANYDLKLNTPDGRLNTEATAGQDNQFTVVLANTGSADLEKLILETKAKDRPQGWTVTYKPEKINLLKAGETKEIQVTIRPSDKTIAGDYMMSVESEPESKQAYANLQVRVTVLAPTIWGWVGVGIVVLVIVALAIMFIRFGRR